ncbi:hypothetical protein L293_0460 [Acinetobacter gyllenbergii CIP 110306 = MTCC 11365]|nr:hypothetical protein L293_0460 [Acinetobacter gyllenbergii CIP 110306 = MTCC 11365]
MSVIAQLKNTKKLIGIPHARHEITPLPFIKKRKSFSPVNSATNHNK